MKIESHLHTAPLSMCSVITYKEAIDALKENGYGAVMLTNHYYSAYAERKGVSFDEWLTLYIDEYHNAFDYGNSVGVKVFLGAEVSTFVPFAERPYLLGYDRQTILDNYADYILYGVTEDFLLNNRMLFDLNQSQLYKLCHDNDILMIQAHPYRVQQGHRLMDINYLDGIEINTHINFEPNEEKVLDEVHKNDLILSVGGDVHGLDFIGSSYYEIPDNIDNSTQLAQYLKETRGKLKYSLKNK